MDADVIVVGAGPAGATAACDLARRGADVLLLDRKKFPRDKTCGDGVPPGSIEILNRLGLGDKIRSAGFYPVRGIRIGAPAGRTWETSFRPRRDGAEFYIAPRLRFDALIQEHAVESGARFVQGAVRGVIVESGRVAGVRVTANMGDTDLRARAVIGADGATSVLARTLRRAPRRPARHRAVAVRSYLEGIDTLPHRVEFYFHKRFVPGYAWIFPLGPDRANVGVIMRVDRYREAGASLEELLGEFLNTPAVAGRLRLGHRMTAAASWQLPNGTTERFHNAFDGALLVGDAAALVDPLTGEGIHNALVSAGIAAEVVSRAIADRDTSLERLAEYDRRCQAELGPSLARSCRVQTWVARAPWWVDLLFSMANAVPDQFDSFLNRMSTDFLIGGSR